LDGSASKVKGPDNFRFECHADSSAESCPSFPAARAGGKAKLGLETRRAPFILRDDQLDRWLDYSEF